MCSTYQLWIFKFNDQSKLGFSGNQTFLINLAFFLCLNTRKTKYCSNTNNCMLSNINFYGNFAARDWFLLIKNSFNYKSDKLFDIMLKATLCVFFVGQEFLKFNSYQLYLSSRLSSRYGNFSSCLKQSSNNNFYGRRRNVFNGFSCYGCLGIFLYNYNYRFF